MKSEAHEKISFISFIEVIVSRNENKGNPIIQREGLQRKSSVHSLIQSREKIKKKLNKKVEYQH